MPQPKLEGSTVFKEKMFSVSYPNSQRTLLIVDSRFRLEEEIPRNTFANICHFVCKHVRMSCTFHYTAVPHSETPKKHVLKLVNKLQPDVVVFVDEMVTAAFAGGETSSFGRLAKTEAFRYLSTVPFRYWTDEKYKKGATGTNLLGFTLRHLIIAASGKYNYKLKKISEENTKAISVTTIKAFDKMMDNLDAAKRVAIDTEGDSLRRVTSKLFTMQFGVLKNGKYLCYVMPWEHRDTPWTAKEFKYIKRRLVEHIDTFKGEHVYHSADFDMGQFMTHLGIKFYSPTLYDIAQAEFLLDENAKFLKNIYGNKPFALEHLERRYGVKRPTTTIVNKEDRKNMAKFSLEELFEYAAWDVLTLLIIMDYQLEQCTHKLHGYTDIDHYKRVIHHQLGITLKVFSTLQNNGIAVDVAHVVALSRRDGIFGKTIDELYDKLMMTEAGQKANQIILKKRGVSGQGLFKKKEGDKPKRVISLTSQEHLQILYYDVMKLEPLRVSEAGNKSTDKAFQTKYAARHPEVAILREFNQNSKLKTAFADSMAKKVASDKDFLHDGRIRPSFGNLAVLTGRLASYYPNAQQIPSRGPLAKPIKRMFIAGVRKMRDKKGQEYIKRRIMLAADFSAHEIRMSGAMAKDPIIIETFAGAAEHIRQYRLGPTPNNLKEALDKLDELIDVHLANVQRFYNLKVTKDHPLRNRIKSVVFSSIYGAEAPKIAKETMQSEVQGAIDTAYKINKILEVLKNEDMKEILAQKEFADLAKEYAKLAEQGTPLIKFLKKKRRETDEVLSREYEYYLEQAEEAFDRLKSVWHVLFEWMADTQKHAAKTFQVHYPNGRIRHLYGYLSNDIWIHRAMDRRATNSPVQGVSSDIGITSIYCAAEWCHRNCWSKGIDFDYVPMNVVHDANYNDVQFEHLPLGVYLLEHAMSTLPARYYKKHFGWDIGVPLGYDIDMGLNWAELKEWRKRPEQLYDMLGEFGETLKQESKHVIHDARQIMNIRMSELEKGVTTPMYLNGERFAEFAPKLRMFRGD